MRTIALEVPIQLLFFKLSSHGFLCGIQSAGNTEATVKSLPCWVIYFTEESDVENLFLKKHQLLDYLLTSDLGRGSMSTWPWNIGSYLFIDVRETTAQKKWLCNNINSTSSFFKCEVPNEMVHKQGDKLKNEGKFISQKGP